MHTRKGTDAFSEKNFETCLVMLIEEVKEKVQRDSPPFKEGKNTRLLGQNTISRQVFGQGGVRTVKKRAVKALPQQ